MSDNIYSQFFDQSTTQDILFCHYRECGKPLPKGSKKYCNLTCCNRENARNQKIRSQASYAQQKLIYDMDPNKCIACGDSITWESFHKSKAKYCSNSCASRITNIHRSQQSRNKQRKTILSRFNNNNEIPTRTFKEIYYSLAAFKFDVQCYPSIMDLNLLKVYGWYSCGGRSTLPLNTNGVTSRRGKPGAFRPWMDSGCLNRLYK
jgi:hypothetical protein